MEPDLRTLGPIDYRARFSSSSRISSHIAFKTARHTANGMPRTQAKYHMYQISSVSRIAVALDGFLINLAPEDLVDPGGVDENQRQEDRGDDEHVEQG